MPGITDQEFENERPAASAVVTDQQFENERPETFGQKAKKLIQSTLVPVPKVKVAPISDAMDPREIQLREMGLTAGPVAPGVAAFEYSRYLLPSTIGAGAGGPRVKPAEEAPPVAEAPTETAPPVEAAPAEAPKPESVPVAAATVSDAEFMNEKPANPYEEAAANILAEKLKNPVKPVVPQTPEEEALLAGAEPKPGKPVAVPSEAITTPGGKLNNVPESYSTKEVLAAVPHLPFGEVAKVDPGGKAGFVLGEAGYSVPERLRIINGEQAWPTKEEFLKKWDNHQWGIGAEIAQRNEPYFRNVGLKTGSLAERYTNGVEYADAMREIDAKQRQTGLRGIPRQRPEVGIVQPNDARGFRRPRRPRVAAAAEQPALPETSSEQPPPTEALPAEPQPSEAAPPATPRPSEAGAVSLEALTPGLESGRNIKEGIQSLLLPTSKSKEHLEAATILNSKVGAMNRDSEIAATALRKDARFFNKLGVHRPETPLEENPGVKFMSDMSVGRKMGPEETRIANKVKALFADRLKKLEDAGVPLEQVRENYFPGMWEDKAAAEQFLSKRPFKGMESFRKPKVFEDIMDGVRAGLKPISNNPIDLVKLKLGEMDRSIMANRALREWEARGDVIAVNNSGRPLKKALQAAFDPSQWEKINDKYGTIWTRDKKTGLPIKVGYRVAKVPTAEIINNYLSSSLYNNRYFGTAFKAYMGTANALNQAQLGMGSFFHGGFTTAEAQVSAGANVIKDVYGVLRGNRSLKDLAGTIAEYPVATIRTAARGSKVLSEFREPTVEIPEDVPVGTLPRTPEERVGVIAKAAELSGGGFEMEYGLRTRQTEAMIRDWYGGRKARAALRSPLAAIEVMAKPILDFLVPRQKAGVFGDLVGRIIEQNPEKTLEDLRPNFRQAWNRVDARLGQVRYDRLFMNNVAKNVIQGIVRAPGWSGGTIAEIGGSAKDTAAFLAEWARTGKMPADIPDRVAYTLSLAITVAAINGALTYAFTGEKPKGEDFWAFRTGNVDENGNPERFTIPTYAKDIWAYWQRPVATLVAKTNPLVGVIADLARNQDYYGTQIRNPEEPVGQQAKDVGEYVASQFTPFWVRGAEKEAQRSGAGIIKTAEKSPLKVLGPQIGVMPAPARMNQTKAERYLSDILSQYPRRPRSKEEAQSHQRVIRYAAAIENAIRKGKNPISPQMVADYRSGKLTAKELDSIWRRLNSGDSLERMIRSPNITFLQALRAYSYATPDEKKAIRDLVIKKGAGLSEAQVKEYWPEISRTFGLARRSAGGKKSKAELMQKYGIE